MSEAANRLLSNLQQLSPADKVEIAEQLLASLSEDEDDELFIAELNRRVEETTSGKRPAIPAEEVFRQLREKYQ